MRRKSSILFMFCASIVLILLPCSAKGAERLNYVTYKQGIYSAESDDLKDTDTKFYGELVFGRYLWPYLSLEAGIQYLDTEGTLSDSDPVLGSITGKVDVTAGGLLVTARGNYPFRFFPIKKGELFAGAGAGLYYVEGEANLSTGAAGEFSIDDEDTVYGVQFELGANIDITTVIFFGISGKYLWVEEAKFEGNAFGAPVEFNVDLTRLVVTANVGFRF